MPALNSYILLSHVSKPFQTQMETTIENLNIPWWQSSHLPIHLTLGQCMGAFKDKPALIAQRNADFSTEIKSVVEAHAKNSAFLLPIDIEITKTGWIIFKYEPVVFESLADTGTESTDIKTIHEGFEAKVQKLQQSYTLKSDQWGANFLPHISMGTIKTKNPDGKPSEAEVEQAQQDLSKNKSKIIGELVKLRTLNLYDFEFLYNDTTGNQIPLYEKTLQRRDFHIQSVSNNNNNYDLKFRNQQDAQQFINFVYLFSGKEYSQRPAATVQLDASIYDRLVGVVDKCHQIAPTSASNVGTMGMFKHNQSGPSTTENKNNILSNIFNGAIISKEKKHGINLVVLSFNNYRDANNLAKKLYDTFHVVSSKKSNTDSPQPKMVNQNQNQYTLALSEKEFEDILHQNKIDPISPSQKTF